MMDHFPAGSLYQRHVLSGFLDYALLAAVGVVWQLYRIVQRARGD